MERIIYSSKRIDDTDSAGYSPDFAAIGEVAAARNRRFGITGFLICTPSWFAQILEGDRQELESVMALILRDKRHFRIRILSCEEGAEKTFPEWGMGWHHQTLNNRILFLEHGLVQDDPPQESDMPAIRRLAQELAKGASASMSHDEPFQERQRANFR